MTEDDELAQIRKKKLEEMMERQRGALAPKRSTVIEVFTSPTCPHCPRALTMAKEVASQNGKSAFVGAPPSIEALRQALRP
ncbi:MAG: hypothetical protein KKG76_01595 [Euryarchaeota archaeon]|nr:hypothetical protein [Euryarchaeota archaeon]